MPPQSSKNPRATMPFHKCLQCIDNHQLGLFKITMKFYQSDLQYLSNKQTNKGDRDGGIYFNSEIVEYSFLTKFNHQLGLLGRRGRGF